jgi:hypothetical protein
LWSDISFSVFKLENESNIKLFSVIFNSTTSSEACCVDPWGSTRKHFCQSTAMWKCWGVYGVWQEGAYFKEWGKNHCSPKDKKGKSIGCLFSVLFMTLRNLVFQAHGYKAFEHLSMSIYEEMPLMLSLP